MKRFRFHLESLLKLRAHKEEEWRMKLGEASARSSAIQQQIHAMLRERVSVFDSDPGNDMAYHSSRALYLGRIEDKTRELENELVEAEEARKKVLEQYNEVRKEYEAIKSIKDKRVAEYRKEWFKEEGKEVDDIANSRVGGGMSG